MSNAVRIYTMKGCGYCSEFKELMTNEGITYKEIDIDEPSNKLEFNKLMEVSNADSVPIVIVGKKILVPERSFFTIEEGFETVKRLISEP
jgi:glutaredoxin